MLIAIQSFAIASTVYAVSRHYGLETGVALALYCPLWAVGLFDFHFDSFALPDLALFFISCESGKIRNAFISAPSLALIKEPFALQREVASIC